MKPIRYKIFFTCLILIAAVSCKKQKEEIPAEMTPPLLVYPDSNISDIDTTVTLRWKRPLNADNVILEYQVYFGDEAVLPMVTNTTDTFYTVSGLKYFTFYKWRVVAFNKENTTSSSSSFWHFWTLREIQNFNPAVTYGTLTDPRDQQVYKTVTINGKTWTAENMNRYVPGSCYYDEKSYNEVYGRLYTYMQALHDACPYGWRLPTNDDYAQMLLYFGTDNFSGELKEAGTLHWLDPNTGASNSTGFTGLPAGYKHPQNGFGEKGKWAIFWINEYIQMDEEAQVISLKYNDSIVRSEMRDIESMMSVRCIQE